MYDQKKIEKEVLEFWKKKKIHKKVRDSTKGNKPFYFLQGPPYTSGKLHAGHAWNNSMKDSVLRYKQMVGFDVWDRAGYDMHGIPTASKVQKELNLKTKEDIEKYGLDKFAKACMEFSVKHAKMMNKDLFGLGIWMDYENAYMPIEEDWIESVWWLIKRAEEEGRLYEGKKTMTWCPTCETALAKHECEYKKIKDKSIYVKFKVKEKDEYLLIWTTTPWTIPFNLAVMANPEVDYIKVKVDNESWIIAKDLADSLIKLKLKKDYTVIDEFKGKDLEHLEYVHPFENEIDYKTLKQNHKKIHTVLLSKEYVTTEAGTGLVHCAPGCGPEDYEVGHKNNILPYNEVDHKGYFKKSMGIFSGLKAKDDDNKFVEELEKKGALVTTETVEHDYAHCERSNDPVIFRTTNQWFFKIEDLKEKMLKYNKQIHWVPKTVKNSFDSWLENLRDNSITKQRFWGTPAPIWRCTECDKYKVISTKEELKSLSKQEPENLHRPWIDKIEIPCECGKTMKRIPDILDVWIDAGVASWACLYFPKRKDLLEKLFPADFILEAREQVRGWFNLLMISSIIGFDKIPFKNVYSHGMLTDVDGVKMSKSIGNVISPYEIVEKYGADALRLYFSQTNAGEDISFSWKELEVKKRNLMILWNTFNYLLEYSKSQKIDPTSLSNNLEIEEKYILSRLNTTIKKVTELYEFYELDKIPIELEKLFLDLSRNYMQYTREKIQEKPELVLSTIYKVLFETMKMLSTITPFITEKMFLELKKEYNLKGDSIAMLRWPKYEESLINKELEEEIAFADQIIQSGLSAREKIKTGVRWPLQNITIVSDSEEAERTIKNLKELIKSKLNVKEILFEKRFFGSKIEVIPNNAQIGKDFQKDSVIIRKDLNEKLLNELNEKGRIKINNFELNKSHIIVKEHLPENLVSSDFNKGKVILETETHEELQLEGFTRELMRRVQDIRKENKLKKQDKIELAIISDLDLTKWKKQIKLKVGANNLDFSKQTYPIQEKLKIKDKEFEIYVKINS
ncbi:isoleucine--tRNA ligase [Candidatus Woesearchaeota archaeon]|jgi:isoleucyl-tRNA synthetase|nr:isoleucine--tRNA ligase [Candidatus Woesearchaeota archaeon]